MSERVMDPAQFSDCWEDDERMNFMFSAFPAARSVNPHHWDTKMMFWKKLIKDMCARSTYGYITWDNLFCHLSRHHKQPLGLHVVFDEMIEKGEIVPTSQYTQDISANDSWIGWGLNWCVKKPVGWMTDKVLSPIKTRLRKDMKRGQFVMISALEHKCKKLLSKFQNYASQNDHDHEFLNIITYSKLQNLCEDILCDSESIDLVLATLRKNRIVDIKTRNELFTTNGNHETNKNDVEGEKYIKFAKNGEKRAFPFSETDIGILRLCETKLHLQTVIDNSYSDIEHRNRIIRECLKLGQKNKAKNLLLKRKRLEASLEKKEGNLNNVEQLLESLHQCKTDNMVMDTFKTAVAAYKDASKAISQDEVEDTMDDVANVLDQHSDVSEALAGPVAAQDEHDLEAELAALISSETNESSISEICDTIASLKIEQELPELPLPPTHCLSHAEAPNDKLDSSQKISSEGL